MTRRARVLAGRDSRAATNELLAGLQRGGFAPRALGGFIADATLRSWREARKRPRAVVEATAVHVAVGALAGRRGLPWIVTSWLMAVTHFGMLEGRRDLGAANVLTVARGALPAAGHRLGSPATVALALATDFADGKLARGTASVTRFGAQGDFLADTALWTWFVLRHERSAAWRVATFAAWAAPVLGVTAVSFARGGMVDLPRSRWFRPAAAVEVLIGGRVLWRWWASRRVSGHLIRRA
ncbi:CDP-alcohol phosphatidyltransferase-like enzyme [Microcella putealis]|uniref:CDP-alcohol phosphatidyltransferase-like enzyme n=1 Tax=Microcella putealis TaxID=337005 RepID=A0A4Q7LYG9_9MICO|nr:CDP-alcohol phosphatidyltransferase family protein [Microcella putealis]RZS59731.1 CDP-alcohol phosphatidyltransferase-like enzyme [Microcella putealis]TQM26844.1 CDP-alcohol phosphatidyltransferase-like enzyme [Microcella putealis]